MASEASYTVRLTSGANELSPRLAAGAGRPEGEADERAGHPLGAADRFLESRGERVEVLLGHHERRKRLHHVHPVAGDLAQDSVVAKERHDDELREEPRLDPLEQLPGARAARRLLEL